MKKNIIKHGRFIILSLFLVFLIFILYLYNANLIFVRYVEHGLITSKTDLGNNYKYEVYIDGKPYTFITKDKFIDLNSGVADFVSRRSVIVKFIGYIKPVKEKIMSRSQTLIELEYSGNANISSKYSVYKRSENDIASKNINSVIVGANNVLIYKDRKNDVKTIIIENDTEPDFIRIGIKNQGFQSFFHSKLEFISDGNLKIQDKKNNTSFYIPPKTRITLTPVSEGIFIESNNMTDVLKGRTYIYPEDSNKLISILTFNRGYGTPNYRGFFEVTQSEGMLRLINELSLENYLYQVVPSEMPSSFGIEALKAQAVAARTYAISDLLSSRYSRNGFHVDDSTMSQVYNNSSENLLASQAVNGTKGLIMKYGNELVDARYYSTSHGYGANVDEIWSSDGSFPGIKKHYLVARSYLLNNAQYDLSSENEAFKFFKDWNLKSYDSNSPYFRWKVTFSKNELQNTINKNLPLVYDGQENYVLTLKGSKFESRTIQSNPVGDLSDINVTKRGGGGNIMELVVSGTNGTYKIIKELNVRYLIRPRKTDTGLDNDIIIKRIKGDDLKNSSLLPSAFMIFEINRGSDGSIKDVTFFGGGYGHSVGMSQYGAGYLSSKGYSFENILKTYYKDIEIEKLY